MPNAARVTDSTAHGAPLGVGPGSENIRIENQPAWRALPAGPLQDSMEAASNAANALMSAATLNPPAAAAKLGELQMSLQQAGLDAAAQGNPDAPAAAGAAATSLTTANASLSAAWAVASAAPGGQPAADIAYTKGLQAAIAAATSAAFSNIGAMTDIHNCPTPCAAGPHGPGIVTRGSLSVRINNLPIARQGDKVFEACGGMDSIAVGATSVEIGE